MKEVYQLEKHELYEMYGGKNGLSDSQVIELKKKYGYNELEEEEKKSIFKIFAEQFADLLVIILIIAALISVFSGNVDSTLVILAVIILNAVLGTVQYVKAEKSLDSLRELSAPKVKVLRGGYKIEIAAKELVPGDVMLLEAGDMVAADGRIIFNHSLQVNESSLTGESSNVEKNERNIKGEAALADRYNMVFSGSLVTYGRAEVLVTSTGMDTEVGKIAALMNDTRDRKTPLQVSLDDFGKKLAAIIMIFSTFVFFVRIWQHEPALDSLMFAVALAVAAIPEALGSIVTIVQAMGTRKMAADKAIIKDLKAVESLGCISVICSDKTGTLTQNKMSVDKLYVDGRCMLPGQTDLTSEVQRYLLYNTILNNDSVVREGVHIGDPTETCLLDMAEKCFSGKDIAVEDIRSMMPRIAELPFDSDRKLMSTQYMVNGIPIVFTKGAVDVLLERSEKIYTCGSVRKLTAADKEKILMQNRMFSENGLRVLAFAYKECADGEKLSADTECSYIFTGLVSMIDPPRREAKSAVRKAIAAGIKPVMITGDHKVTARAIAGQLGIYNEGDIALTGQELDKLTDGELDNIVPHVSVYARVSPENKIRIVDAWQRRGNVVAMTGDGVNDAPALRKADIGVAMGITGTEVSKDASGMILADDNFATLIKAVLNGRNVYRNIMNAIQFLLSGNMAAIIVVLFCSVMGLSTPFEPVHLLFINLLTDSLPALAIGMEPSDNMLLNNKPRNPKKGILNRRFVLHLIVYGILIAAATQTSYFIGAQSDAVTASTMAFATLTLARLFHGFNCRSESSMARIGFRSNMWSVAAFIAGTVFLAVILFVPVLRTPFMVTELSYKQVMCIVFLALEPTILIQYKKDIFDKKGVKT